MEVIGLVNQTSLSLNSGLGINIEEVKDWITELGYLTEYSDKDLTKITYSELKTLRDNGQLTEGHLYRITDYVTTTVQSETKSANHPFDIIVTALSENTLDEKASAIAHEGDTYFDGNDLGAWELWYDLDNDTEKYAWADATNGKGVIYRMIDEKRNDCPYDFKNILFYNYKIDDSYYYTFSYVVSGKLYDGTVEKQITNCHSNSIWTYIINKKKSLNKNVFRNISVNAWCYNNTFGNNCSSNIFGNNCISNIFGNNCIYNTFGDNCSSNTFGNNCQLNRFSSYCQYNRFSNSCSNNTLGSLCNCNTLGNYCNYNIFSSICTCNTLGNTCSSNIFGYSCNYNTLGNLCDDIHVDGNKTSITFSDEYYDDGSGQLVPIKHPDLSTQPSILPYKFMGLYVYEQLIPLTKSEKQKLTTTEEFNIYLNTAERLIEFAIDNPIFIDASIFVWGRDDYDSGVGNMPLFSPAVIDRGNCNAEHPRLVEFMVTYQKMNLGYRLKHIKGAYLRVVYTSAFEEDYYGYNSY